MEQGKWLFGSLLGVAEEYHHFQIFKLSHFQIA
jgi:hypothetical protein